jgi:LmbE family N-acetylglucosaminyl deacetylase
VKTVLVFAPHPDDAEYYAGGTLALLAQQGHRVVIVTVTSGDKGSYRYTAAELAALRREEAKKAAALLGAADILFLGHPDQELDLLPAGVLREQFVRLIRQYQPDVLVAEDVRYTEEPHPDHRAVARAAADAVAYASLPLVYPAHAKSGLEPHFVKEKLYYSESPALTDKVIDITATFERKMEALAAHQSQVEFLVEDILHQAEAAGLGSHELVAAARQDPLAALTLAIHQQAAAAGSRAGYALGEAFRYERFHPIVESMLVS